MGKSLGMMICKMFSYVSDWIFREIIYRETVQIRQLLLAKLMQILNVTCFIFICSLDTCFVVEYCCTIIHLDNFFYFLNLQYRLVAEPHSTSAFVEEERSCPVSLNTSMDQHTRIPRPICPSPPSLGELPDSS